MMKSLFRGAHCEKKKHLCYLQYVARIICRFVSIYCQTYAIERIHVNSFQGQFVRADNTAIFRIVFPGMPYLKKTG